MDTCFNVLHYPNWAERRIMRRCQIGAPAPRMLGELAGIQATPRDTDKIVQVGSVRFKIEERNAARSANREPTEKQRAWLEAIVMKLERGQ